MRLNLKTKYTFLLVAFCCLNIQCKKEQEIDKLPEATSVGAGTFGCLMNGMAWPNGIDGDKSYSASYYYGNLAVNYEIQDGPTWGPIKGAVGFAIKNIFKPGIYVLPFNNTKKGTANIIHQGLFYFSKDPINKGGQAYFTITRLDSVNRIVSGTFEFTLFDQDDFSRKVEVKSGRFDLTM